MVVFPCNSCTSASRVEVGYPSHFLVSSPWSFGVCTLYPLVRKGIPVVSCWNTGPHWWEVWHIPSKLLELLTSVHQLASPQMQWWRKEYCSSYYLSCQIASTAVGGASSLQITAVKGFHVPLLHSVEISWVIDTRRGLNPWRPGHCPHQNT